jgi:hypothetical protein
VRRYSCILFLCFCPAAFAAPEGGPWTASLYYGPATTKYFVATVMSQNMHPTGTMLGLALDRKLFHLGYDISLAAEGQVTQYEFGHLDTVFALGLGFQADRLFGFERLSFSFYDGPSYGLNPPATSIGYKGKVWGATRKKTLNYLNAELAVGIPRWKRTDAVFRLYHRSGVFGLYSDGDDDGLAFGAGLRYHF